MVSIILFVKRRDNGDAPVQQNAVAEQSRAILGYTGIVHGGYKCVLRGVACWVENREAPD